MTRHREAAVSLVMNATRPVTCLRVNRLVGTPGLDPIPPQPVIACRTGMDRPIVEPDEAIFGVFGGSVEVYTCGFDA